MTQHDELIAALGAWSPTLADGIARDAPLLTSGRLDSVALFQLLMWIEGRIGRPIDVTAIDMPTEWNTVDMIIAYVAREKSR